MEFSIILEVCLNDFNYACLHINDYDESSEWSWKYKTFFWWFMHANFYSLDLGY